MAFIAETDVIKVHSSDDHSIVGQCVLTLYPSQDDLESCSRDTVQSETPGGAYLICIVFIVYQHPCLLLIHKW